MPRIACPCCGFYTLDQPHGSYDICPVCFWEDDPVQFRDPAYRGGANRVSLEEARRNFRAYGATDGDVSDYVRPPRLDETQSWDTTGVLRALGALAYPEFGCIRED